MMAKNKARSLKYRPVFLKMHVFKKNLG